jgi:hypothetical protein
MELKVKVKREVNLEIMRVRKEMLKVTRMSLKSSVRLYLL